jgi:hypothetical protein
MRRCVMIQPRMDTNKTTNWVRLGRSIRVPSARGPIRRGERAGDRAFGITNFLVNGKGNQVAAATAPEIQAIGVNCPYLLRAAPTYGAMRSVRVSV